MPLTILDADALQSTFARWEIVRYLTHLVPWPYPAGEASRYIREDALPAMADDSEWHWTLRLRETPEVIVGAVCLMEEQDNNRGFWLIPELHGLGLMTEVCQAVNHYWFDSLGKSLMRVAKASANVASRKLSQREGMQLVACRPDTFVCGPMQEEVWELTRQQWLYRQPTGRTIDLGA